MDGKADIYSRSLKICSNCSLAFYPRRESASDKNAVPEAIFADAPAKVLRPYPRATASPLSLEKRALARVSKDEGSPSFETRSCGPLLRMRSGLAFRPVMR